MKLKVWGTRGSIPISGEEFNKYGGETSCYEVVSENGDVIILDAGTGLRKLGKDLLRRKKDTMHLIFSHFHWDHVMGFPFFPQIYIPTSNIHMYGVFNIPIPLTEMFQKAMSAPNFPQDFTQLQSNITIHKNVIGKEIGTVKFDSIALNHPNNAQGIKLSEKGKSIIYFTDNELGIEYATGSKFEKFVEFCSNCDILLQDSEFTPEDYKIKEGWGHSCYLDALELAIQAKVKKYILIHHNQDRTDVGVDEILNECKKIAKERKSNIIIEAAYEGMEIDL